MKSSTVLPVIAALLLGGGLLFWAFFGGTAQKDPNISPLALERTSEYPPFAPSGPALHGYETYENSRYGFSFSHEPEASVKEYDEGGRAMTVTVENIADMRGFQIFIVPYAEAEISEERFKADVPSGVRTDVRNVSVDGVRAVTFTSYNALFGETEELWLIRDGYLYEITTLKGVSDWFMPIMQTWNFF